MANRRDSNGPRTRHPAGNGDGRDPNPINAEEHDDGRPGISIAEHIRGAQFWSESLQNWQSEFLVLGAMAVLSISLRQRGSPESKPVDALHCSTGHQ